MRVNGMLQRFKVEGQMDKLFNRLNLYDILAMICPGGMWLLCLATIFDHTKDWNARNWLWVETINNAQPEMSSALVLGLLIFVVAYMTGLLQDSLLHILRELLRMIKLDVIAVAAWCLSIVKKEHKDILKKIRTDREKYYTIRAEALDDDKNGTILTMEYQCAMLKSMLLPLSLLVALCFDTKQGRIIAFVVTALILGVLLFLRTIRSLRAILRHYK